MNIQHALSELLNALGFEQMAKDVSLETDKDRLTKYAQVVLKSSPHDKRVRLFELFNQAGLYPKIPA